MINYSEIREIHLELSTRCNAACPGCIRNLYGVETPAITDGYPLCDLKLEDIKKIFPAEFIQQLKLFLINGNYGDFVTARDGLEVIKYLAEINPTMEIIVSTNGSARTGWWSELGKIPNLEVQFCLDGLKDTHHLYRRNTNWDLIIANAKTFIAAGGRATWKMIKFDVNEHQIESCKTLSKDLGFSDFLLFDHGRNYFPVFDYSGEYLHSIGGHPESSFDQVLMKHREGEHHVPLQVTSVDCYAKNSKSIYVCANGEVYPCCFLGIYPQMSKMLHGQEIAPYVKNNNALQHGLQHAIEWFSDLATTFQKDQLYVCKLNCGCD